MSLRTSLLHKEIQRSLLLDFQPYQMMKVLIVSDIHANWTALRTVLAAEQDYDNILCLGDLVDYAPSPSNAWVGR